MSRQVNRTLFTKPRLHLHDVAQAVRADLFFTRVAVPKPLTEGPEVMILTRVGPASR